MKHHVPISAKFIFAVLTLCGVTSTIFALQGGGKKLTGYDAIAIEKVTVEQGEKTEGFPEEYGVALRQCTLERLRKKNLFNDVSEAAEGTAQPPAGGEAKRLILSGVVIEYKKGSRAKRYFIGYGAGATKVRVRFLFRDAATGQEVLRTEREGSYSGVLSLAGGGKKEANEEAVGDVVDGLIKDILKNR